MKNAFQIPTRVLATLAAILSGVLADSARAGNITADNLTVNQTSSFAGTATFSGGLQSGSTNSYGYQAWSLTNTGNAKFTSVSLANGGNPVIWYDGSTHVDGDLLTLSSNTWLSGDGLYFAGGGGLSYDGSLYVNGGSISMNGGNIYMNGNTFLDSSGSVYLMGSGIYDWNGNNIIYPDGTIYLDSSGSGIRDQNGNSLMQADGTIYVQGSGIIDWNGNTVISPGGWATFVNGVTLPGWDGYQSGVDQYGSAVFKDLTIFPRTGLTGNGQTTLDGILTNGHAPGWVTQVNINGTISTYVLTAGTDATNLPSIVRPADYNASVNAKVWKLATTSLGTSSVNGNLGIGVSPTSRLTLPTGTTAADGITFGDINLYRGSSTSLVTSAQNVIVPNGGSFGIDNNNKIQFGTGQNVNILSAGNSAVFVNGTNGNVGIGTTAPRQRLEINGTLLTAGVASGYGGFGTAVAASGKTFSAGYDLTNDTAYIRSENNNSAWMPLALSASVYKFNSGSTNLLTINPSGVGIGTTAPAAKLDVLAGRANINLSTTQVPIQVLSKTPALQITGTGDENNPATIGLIQTSVNTIGNQMQGNTGIDLVATRSALASIGTRSAVGTGDWTGAIRYVGDDGVNLRTIGAYVAGIVNTSTQSVSSGVIPTELQLASRFQAPVTLHTNSSERMRIDPTGNVGIGTTAPGAKLDVNGDAAVNGHLRGVIPYTALVGNTANTLDGIVTVAKPTGQVAQVVIAGQGYTYELIVGTNATSSPTLIRPVDYNASTNPKVWRLTGTVVGNLTVNGAINGQVTSLSAGNTTVSALTAGTANVSSLTTTDFNGTNLFSSYASFWSISTDDVNAGYIASNSATITSISGDEANIYNLNSTNAYLDSATINNLTANGGTAYLDYVHANSAEVGTLTFDAIYGGNVYGSDGTFSGNISAYNGTWNLLTTADLTASGNVGIGTTTPARKLDVIGSTGSRIGYSATDSSTAPTTIANASYLQIGGQEHLINSYRLLTFGFNGNTNYTNPPAYLGFQETTPAAGTAGDLVFGTRTVTTNTAASERMRITSAGSVGIGTAAPVAKLDVVGDAAIAGHLRGVQPYNALTGGTGSDAIDGIVTVNKAAGQLVQTMYGTTLNTYRLTAGTDAQSVPNVIRPLDYNASTNAKVWKVISAGSSSGGTFTVPNIVATSGTIDTFTSSTANFGHVGADDGYFSGLTAPYATIDNLYSSSIEASGANIYGTMSVNEVQSDYVYGSSIEGSYANFSSLQVSGTAYIGAVQSDYVYGGGVEGSYANFSGTLTSYQITTSGSVGIGTGTPQASLDVIGNAALGTGVTSSLTGQVVVGKYNDTRTNDTTSGAAVNHTQGVFIVASGTSSSAKANAMRVLADGTVLVKPSGDISMTGFQNGQRP